MNFFDLSCNSLFLPMDRILYELFALPHPPNSISPSYLPDSLNKFQTDLFIGDIHFLRLFVIGQIAQMDQQCQHIVSVPESHQIICKAFRVNLRFHPADKFCHRPAQSVKIKVDVSHQTLRGRSLGPVRIKIIIAD